MTTTASPTPLELAAASDATQRWHALTATQNADPAEQARIDMAGRLADATLAGATRCGWLRPRTTSDLDPVAAAEAWSRIALLWHRVLADTDAFTTARAHANAACHLDPDEVRAWLDSPDGDTTTGDRLLGAEFGLSAFHKWAHITALVGEAQHAGVLRVPGHRVGILHLANDRGFIDRHRITLTTPIHGTLCSPDIDTLDLLTDHLSGVDAAVHLLTVVAQETDHLLAHRALLADIAPPPNTPPPASIDTDDGAPAGDASTPGGRTDPGQR